MSRKKAAYQTARFDAIPPLMYNIRYFWLQYSASVRAAARDFEVSEATLRRRVNNKIPTKKPHNHMYRTAAEDINRVHQYFEKLKIQLDKGIPPEDIWNMDETGFRLGVGSDDVIVTKRSRAYKHHISLP
ncbi:hypothetical protein Micbo1qcDRAFT_212541 [Microdochium bolleyi]|uniref:HTH psq-type domain-containing protein n=1 Tax=Microdochium bolleyi TaxID=196109 RepID=A0A136IIB3_9PEZI|nr:hypothetical protein Micbo1qcDRAFT_212541 [Microdochium bolleyi]